MQTILANNPHFEHVLLVVDQLEELFTLGQDEREVRAFVAAIVNAVTKASNTSVILLLRADFYADVMVYPDLAELVSRNQVFIDSMSLEELREAIERPAQVAGGSFEPGLVDRLLKECARESPAHCRCSRSSLHQLWERRRGGWLTHDAYDEIGGVSGALEGRAEQTYGRLTSELKPVAKRVILRLVQFGEGVPDFQAPRSAGRSGAGQRRSKGCARCCESVRGCPAAGDWNRRCRQGNRRAGA